MVLIRAVVTAISLEVVSCGFSFLSVHDVVVFPYVIRIFLISFETCVEVRTHVGIVLSIGGQGCHVCYEAACPL